MKQEDKELLFKELCARLPYGIHVYIEFENGNILDDTVLNAQYIHDWVAVPSCKNMAIKPYLRPMSSMTEEERLYFHRNASRVPILVDEEKSMVKEFWGYTTHLLDWLLEHHFDYRGLIEKGLALEAPEGIYKTE